MALGSIAPGDSANRRITVPKWYLAYFLLAVFDILTVTAGLLLSHTLMGIFSGSVSLNSEWAQRQAMLAELRIQAGAVNAPGNDVFDSRDVARESEHMRAALSAFNAQLGEIRDEVRRNVEPAQQAPLFAHLARAEQAMHAMIAEAAQIFAFFGQGLPDRAGERMATMDRKYAAVNQAFAQLESHIRAVQARNFEQQRQEARWFQRFEYLIGAAIVLMVLGASIYGHRVYRQMSADAREKEKYLRELSTARDEALQGARAKSEFLAKMSHEIRTPMNGVLGMAELLLNTTLNSKQRLFADTIHRSGETLLAVINDILDFSKIESGKLELDSVDFAVRDLAEDVVELLAERAHGKGLELICRVDEDVPALLRGDEIRLRQILLNLVGNAVKFTERGEVLVEVKLAAPPRTNSKIALHIAVTDSGPGIAPEQQRRVFEPFTQSDDSTTRKHGGTGLGLPIARELVRLMGGELELESELGRGARFRFTALFEPANTQSVAATRSAPTNLQGVTALIVDDNATNRQILTYQLNGWGIHVITAESGFDALTVFRAGDSKRLDLAILDMHMPEMDGLQLAQRINALPMGAQLPLIMLSSIGRDMPSVTLQKFGIARWVTKPVRQSQLYNAIVHVLGKSGVAAMLEKVAPAHLAGLGGKVLLAEDNRVNQELALAMLEDFGCETEIVVNGRAAVDAVMRTNFDVILMDCQMPEMDGYEATAAIRDWEQRTRAADSNATRRLPIVALTANAMAGDRERCLAAGMDDYLSKPFGRAQLYSVLQRWLTVPALGTAR